MTNSQYASSWKFNVLGNLYASLGFNIFKNSRKRGKLMLSVEWYCRIISSVETCIEKWAPRNCHNWDFDWSSEEEDQRIKALFWRFFKSHVQAVLMISGVEMNYVKMLYKRGTCFRGEAWHIALLPIYITEDAERCFLWNFHGAWSRARSSPSPGVPTLCINKRVVQDEDIEIYKMMIWNLLEEENAVWKK